MYSCDSLFLFCFRDVSILWRSTSLFLLHAQSLWLIFGNHQTRDLIAQVVTENRHDEESFDCLLFEFCFRSEWILWKADSFSRFIILSKKASHFRWSTDERLVRLSLSVILFYLKLTDNSSHWIEANVTVRMKRIDIRIDIRSLDFHHVGGQKRDMLSCFRQSSLNQSLFIYNLRVRS